MRNGTKRWLKQSVTLTPAAGTYDAMGQPVMGTATTVRCLIQSRTHNMLDKNGSDVMSHNQIMVDGDTVVSVDDHVVMPDGSIPPIINIRYEYGFTGNILYKVIYT